MSGLYINESGEPVKRRALPKVMWCVDHGPDESHLLDADWFERLKDARQFVARLRPSNSGRPRPYKITRWDWRDSNVYGTYATTCLVDTNIPNPLGKRGR